MGMGMHGAMRGMMNASDEKPKVTWALLGRVLVYARPYRWQIAGMLFIIVIQTGLGLLSPLIMRDLIDTTIPAGDLNRLLLLALALLFIPVLDGVGDYIERNWHSSVGEGVTTCVWRCSDICSVCRCASSPTPRLAR
jgi:ATP-binding cassette subfamily B protein